VTHQYNLLPPKVRQTQRSGGIRAWAKEHGLTVSERGRIPTYVLEQYQAATGGR
jgi:hypothetical protein